MAVRQEDEQAGKRVNPSKARTRWRAFAGLVLAAACALAGAAPAAAADPTDSTDLTAQTAPATDPASPAAVPAAEHEEDSDESSAETLSLAGATPTVTASSGYHLKVTVANTTGKAWPAGRLTALTNAGFTFRSRSDIQHWAEGGTAIPTRAELGGADVPALKPGQSVTVAIDAPADDPTLARIVSWGPKPVRIDYATTGDPGDGQEAASAQLHTFMTRSADGLTALDTPALRLTVALPLTGGQWGANATADELLSSGLPQDTGGEDAEAIAAGLDAGGAVTPDQAAAEQRAQAARQLATDHPELQVIVDPTFAQALPEPVAAAAITQPGGFDITAYAAKSDAAAYERAGVGTAAWTADAALADYRAAMGDATAQVPVVATQGAGAWTAAALTEAKRQGYDTVIAGSDYEGTQPDTVHSANSEVSTDAGLVTVLVEQRELGTLAKGRATAAKAAGERTAAGRIARFIAQSAFYQMEQPYLARNLLTCLGGDVADGQADALMDAIEQAPWLQLTGLGELTDGDAYESGDEALGTVPQDAALTESQATSLDAVLSDLAASRAQIDRFGSAVLDGAYGAADDAQALARGGGQAGEGSGADRWLARLHAVHDALALHALAGPWLGSTGGAMRAARTARAHATEQARDFANRLMTGVTITPTDAVTVVSETAKMPVTVRNGHPYPVTVTVSSKTDSMEIVTSRTTSVTIPANGEAQVAFAIRVSTSGSTVATLSLLDREGDPFGAQQTTPITSVLRISDKTGFVIIGLAVVMAALGLWRQFHRKKDPDE